MHSVLCQESLFGSLREEPEPRRFKLAPRNGFSFPSPRATPCPARPARSRQSDERVLASSVLGRRTGGDTVARSPQDTQPGPSTRCATLSFATCLGSSDIVFVPVIKWEKRVITLEGTAPWQSWGAHSTALPVRGTWPQAPASAQHFSSLGAGRACSLRAGASSGYAGAYAPFAPRASPAAPPKITRGRPVTILRYASRRRNTTRDPNYKAS